MSRWGYASWAVTFFSVAAIVARAPEPPMAFVVVFFVCFLAVLCAGFVDTHRYDESRRDEP